MFALQRYQVLNDQLPIAQVWVWPVMVCVIVGVFGLVIVGVFGALSRQFPEARIEDIAKALATVFNSLHRNRRGQG